MTTSIPRKAFAVTLTKAHQAVSSCLPEYLPIRLVTDVQHSSAPSERDAYSADFAHFRSWGLRRVSPFGSSLRTGAGATRQNLLRPGADGARGGGAAWPLRSPRSAQVARTRCPDAVETALSMSPRVCRSQLPEV